jgi:hypothetical protein
VWVVSINDMTNIAQLAFLSGITHAASPLTLRTWLRRPPILTAIRLVLIFLSFVGVFAAGMFSLLPLDVKNPCAVMCYFDPAPGLRLALVYFTLAMPMMAVFFLSSLYWTVLIRLLHPDHVLVIRRRLPLFGIRWSGRQTHSDVLDAWIRRSQETGLISVKAKLVSSIKVTLDPTTGWGIIAGIILEIAFPRVTL